MNGILFKPQKAQAIRENPDKIWQTRRLSGLKEINKEPNLWTYHEECSIPEQNRFTFFYDNQKPYHSETAILVVHPRYHTGEVVYLKEAHWQYGYWYKTGNLTESGHEEWEFKAKTNEVLFESPYPSSLPRNQLGWHKRSPLFMPAWAARDHYRILSVKPERLQEITLADIYAEGCPCVVVADYLSDPEEGYRLREDAYEWYASLWDSINLKYKWASNPFVWVYQFVKVENSTWYSILSNQGKDK